LLSAKKILPGKSAQIEAKINTNRLTGPIEKRITVSSNDPEHPSVTLLIKGVVEPEIALSDSDLSFGRVPAQKEVAKEAILTAAAGTSIKVLSASSTNAAFAAKLEPVPASKGKKWRLTVVHKANAKPGAFRAEITVKTDSRLTPEISVYARGETIAPTK
jgi:hypothetical protein